MIPLRDDLPGGGAPPVTYVLSVALLAWGCAAPGGGILLGLFAALAAWVWSPSLARETVWAVPVAASAAAAGVTLLTAGGTGSTQAWAVAAAALSIVVLHLARHPRARVLGLVLVPFRSFLTSLPNMAVAAVWIPLTCAAVAIG